MRVKLINGGEKDTTDFARKCLLAIISKVVAIDVHIIGLFIAVTICVDIITTLAIIDFIIIIIIMLTPCVFRRLKRGALSDCLRG